MSIRAIKEATGNIEGEAIAFAQKLVQTPSISGEEEEVAVLILDRMRKLGYDEAFRDSIGNVVGVIKGSGVGQNTMFNCHMDHVDPGRLEAWQYEPYAGTIADGYLHGRGSCDVKGAIACQVYGAALIKQFSLSHRGDIIVTGVVQEEPAEALGMSYLCDVTLPERGIRYDFVVLGEPTGLNISLGHRGRVELEIKTLGRTSHGSAPWRGINAVYKMLPVINALQDLAPRLPQHHLLGKSTVALTCIGCSPGRLSIIPDECTISLDRRLLPSESLEAVVAQIDAILKQIRGEDAQFEGTVKVREVEETSYTGMKKRVKKYLSSWTTPEDDPNVVRAGDALRELGEMPEFVYWDFATDGGHTAGILGIPTIGYAPAEEQYAHTPQEKVSLDFLRRAIAGNTAIALAITE